MSLNEQQKKILLQVAKASISHGLDYGKPLTVALPDYPPELAEQRASFVTLERNGQLRGCIGMLEACRPLLIDVAENAFAAAFRDPRFPQLNRAEASEIELHISILTPSEPMHFSSEADLLGQLRPGVDGLILVDGGRRGTFLPSVWDSLPEPKQFFRHLKQKAGLPADYWSATLRVFRYGAEYIP